MKLCGNYDIQSRDAELIVSDRRYYGKRLSTIVQGETPWDGIYWAIEIY